jgi:hypothetical protein
MTGYTETGQFSLWCRSQERGEALAELEAARPAGRIVVVMD